MHIILGFQSEFFCLTFILVRPCNFTLAAQVSYSAGSCPDMITVGDFNNDNQLDIAAAIACSGRVGIFLGYGNGTFKLEITSLTSSLSSAYSIVAGDFNNDHLLDIALSDRSGTNFGVLLGIGNGNFPSDNDISNWFYFLLDRCW